MALIQFKGIKEGEIFNKWLHSRLIRHNKNVLSAELGSTGSGKSYRDLRKAELWYEFHFNKKFPVENICFGVGQTMEILSSERLKRGDILVIEEAGVNLGSRNWQSKVSKMFNFVLQSFRSMNIGLFFNLPYLSMLDSQARHLLHYYAESSGIDFEKKTNECKPFFLQVAQASGKIYRHYPKVKTNGKTIKVKRFVYSLPSQYLIDAYEDKKAKYLKDLIKEYADKTNGVVKDDMPTVDEFRAYDLLELKDKDGKKMYTQEEVAKKIGKSQRTVSNYKKKVDNYSILLNMKANARENVVLAGKKSLKIPSNLTHK